MQKERKSTKSKTHIFVAAFVFFSAVALYLISGSSNAFRANLEDLIREELICVDPQPPPNIVDAIYVLGGSQSSLKFKFKTAADLYHKGVCKRILILSRPGKTEYSSLLRRNLTNDEWAILKLRQFGIPEKNIDTIHMKDEFFGTLTEATNISRLIKKRGYNHVVLVSSPYHTHRVKISFEKFLKHQNVTFYVQGSDERASLRQLIIEFVKFKIYKYFLVS